MERDSAAAAAADFFRTPAQSWRSQNIKRFEHLRRLELDNNTEKEIAVLNNLMSVGSEQQNHNGGYVTSLQPRSSLVQLIFFLFSFPDLAHETQIIRRRYQNDLFGI
jgi:hypothetical protein